MELLLILGQIQGDLLPGGLIILLLADLLVLEHVLENQSLSHDRVLRVIDRIIIARAIGNGAQISDLRQAQLADILAEIALGSGSDAVEAIHEIDIIDVEVEDLVLGVFLLHFQGNKDLLHLALPGLILGQKDRSRQLLGNRGSAP